MRILRLFRGGKWELPHEKLEFFEPGLLCGQGKFERRGADGQL